MVLQTCLKYKICFLKVSFALYEHLYEQLFGYKFIFSISQGYQMHPVWLPDPYNRVAICAVLRGFGLIVTFFLLIWLQIYIQSNCCKKMYPYISGLPSIPNKATRSTMAVLADVWFSWILGLFFPFWVLWLKMDARLL